MSATAASIAWSMCPGSVAFMNSAMMRSTAAGSSTCGYGPPDADRPDPVTHAATPGIASAAAAAAVDGAYREPVGALAGYVPGDWF